MCTVLRVRRRRINVQASCVDGETKLFDAIDEIVKATTR